MSELDQTTPQEPTETVRNESFISQVFTKYQQYEALRRNNIPRELALHAVLGEHAESLIARIEAGVEDRNPWAGMILHALGEFVHDPLPFFPHLSQPQGEVKITPVEDEPSEPEK